VIRAGSVVTSSLPPLCVAVGVPAKPGRNVRFFSTDLTTLGAAEVRALVVP